MKGLLIKDFCIIAKNKKLFGILLMLSIIIFFMQSEGIGYFIISYMTVFGGSLVLATISTDEFDKSTMFLMTMPINRRTYALEKYAFSFACSFACWIVSTALCCIMAGSVAMETIEVALVLLIVLSLFQLIMIPVQLKFGGENGRMVIMGMVVVILAVGFVVKKVMLTVFDSEEAISLWIQGMIKVFEELKPLPIIIGIAAGLGLGFLISAGISIRTMEKREF